MRRLRRFVRRLTASAARRRDDERLREELEHHIALQTDANVSAGMSAEDARRHAVGGARTMFVCSADWRFS